MFIVKVIVSVLMNLGIFGGLLFLPAGTLDWWRAWVFLGVVFIGTSATLLGVFRNRQDLLDERFKPPIQEGQPLADKIVLLLFIATFFAVIAFIPLDVFRFHILPKPGTFASSLGIILFIAGWWIIFLSFRENAFAAPVVKHQVERHQTVIDSGVYGIVRHPMYAGALCLC
jgi:protein-S-isoprenylcysteine O-methyltransferase Ste14